MRKLINRARGIAGGGPLVLDQRGLSTVEYVIILVIIAVLGISVWRKFGTAIRDKITYSQDRLEKVDKEDTSDGTGSETPGGG